MKFGKKTAAVVLLFAALVLINYLASAARLRADLTADRTYTLSPGTEALLGKIEEPITLQFYFSRSLKNLPVLFKNYATRVEELLHQYAAASGGRIRLVVTDPKPDTPEEEAATRARLTGQPLGDGTNLFLGLVATQADQEKSIAFLTPAREQFLEYDISKLLHSVQLFSKPKLGLLTSLPLRAPGFQMPGMRQPQQQGQVAAEEWEQSFDIVEVQPSATELPADLDALAVIHPEGVSDQLQFAIDQYVLSGKPLLLAVDPSSRHFAAQGRQMQMYGGQPQNTSSDLPRLLAAWGVAYDSHKVVGDLEHAYLAQTQNGTASFPPWLLLDATNIAPDFLPASGVKDLLLLEAGAFTLAPPDGLEAKPVLESGTQSGLVDAMLMQFGGAAEVSKQVKPDGKKQVLAAILRGTFHTAFPDGAPKAADTTKDDKADDAKPAAPALAASAQPGTVFLVADTDWLLDEASLDPRYLRAGIAYPINGNLSFGTSLVDFLGGSRDLIDLRSKGTAQRPFEVIRRMQLAAQSAYQDRLDQLEGSLQAVQQRLSELLQNQKDQTRIVATPEMQAELEKFRTEEARLRTERRAIKRSLNEGIEKLQNTLIGLNLLAMPGLIAVGGIWFFRRRNQRQRL